VTAPACDYRALEALALRVRAHAVRMATDGGCFLGASLSCADILVYLYTCWLRVRADRPDDPARDVLLLSKGHDVPALYGTLAELGWFPRERLAQHLRAGHSMYWHPNRAIPGVEFHSGSLGHLLSVGAGIVYDAKLRGADTRVVVILGDGELNEGSVWETALVAAAHRLDNLIAVVDRNEFQANARTEELIPLEPLTHKWSAFGWEVDDVDGHDFAALDGAFNAIHAGAGRPRAIIARTVRGKGLPSIEGRADRWFCDVSAAEVGALLAELHGNGRADLHAAPLMVR